MDQITPGMTYGLAAIGRRCLFDPSFAHRLAVVQDPYPPDLGPLLFFLGLMAIIFVASGLVGTDGITALIYILSGAAK